jgi:hypothetical protein
MYQTKWLAHGQIPFQIDFHVGRADGMSEGSVDADATYPTSTACPTVEICLLSGPFLSSGPLGEPPALGFYSMDRGCHYLKMGYGVPSLNKDENRVTVEMEE